MKRQIFLVLGIMLLLGAAVLYGRLSAPEPDATYFVHVETKEPLDKVAVFARLGHPGDCLTLQDLDAAATGAQECHAFRPFESEAALHGKFPTAGAAYLVRVRELEREDGVRRFDVSLLHRDDDGVVKPYANAGAFKFPSEGGLNDDVPTRLAETVARLSFK